MNRFHLKYAALVIVLVLSSATRLFAQPPSPTAATPPPETPGLLPEPGAISKGIAYADRKFNRGGEPRDVRLTVGERSRRA